MASLSATTLGALAVVGLTCAFSRSSTLVKRAQAPGVLRALWSMATVRLVGDATGVAQDERVPTSESGRSWAAGGGADWRRRLMIQLRMGAENRAPLARSFISAPKVPERFFEFRTVFLGPLASTSPWRIMSTWENTGMISST